MKKIIALAALFVCLSCGVSKTKRPAGECEFCYRINCTMHDKCSAKYVKPNGDTAYANSCKGLVLELLKNGDTVVILNANKK